MIINPEQLAVTTKVFIKPMFKKKDRRIVRYCSPAKVKESTRRQVHQAKCGKRETYERCTSAEMNRKLTAALKREVLQLCSHPVIGWRDAPPGIFGLWFIRVAAI